VSNFLGLDQKATDRAKAKFVIIPCPHEATTSYGQGTKHGPAAILKASSQVEWFDQELGDEPVVKAGIFTEKPTGISGLEARVTASLNEGKVPVILGGEHSLSPAAVKACKARYPDLSVLHFDAHADLRDSYRGRRDSHACAARRIWEITRALVQVGVRSLSREEHDWAKKVKLAKAKLTRHVYISLDVDVFDPAVIPATGTPEPGGLLWPDVLGRLKKVCAKHVVVGFDVVELSPRRDDRASDFTAARLVYKLIGLLT
jgi:agmatinase